MPPKASKRKYRKTTPETSAGTAPGAKATPEKSSPDSDAWERHFHGAPGTGNVAAVSMFGAEDPDMPGVNVWKRFCEMGGTAESPKELAIAAMYETTYEGAYTEFWNEYTQLLHEYAVGKRFLVVITMQSGYIGFVQQQEVKFIERCRAQELSNLSVASTRELKKSVSTNEVKLPRPDFSTSIKLAMTFKRFQEWAKTNYAEEALGDGEIPTLGQAQAEFKRLLDRTKLVRQAEAWERGVATATLGSERFVLQPHGGFRTGWDAVQVFMLGYVGLVVPFRTGFGIYVELFSLKWWIELLVDLFFIFDILLNFRTGVILDTGQVDMRAKTIAYSYVCKGWFLLDVISCLPINYIAQAKQSSVARENSELKLLKIARLFRLAKLLRIGRLKRIIRRHADGIEDALPALSILGLLSGMCFLIHVIACGWYAVGVDEAPQPQQDGQQRQLGWISRQTLEVWNSTRDRTTIDTATQYVAAAYWAATQISVSGPSDITPETYIERVFAAWTAVIGCLVYAALITTFGTILVTKKLLVRQQTPSEIAPSFRAASPGLSADLQPV